MSEERDHTRHPLSEQQPKPEFRIFWMPLSASNQRLKTLLFSLNSFLIPTQHQCQHQCQCQSLVQIRLFLLLKVQIPLRFLNSCLPYFETSEFIPDNPDSDSASVSVSVQSVVQIRLFLLPKLQPQSFQAQLHVVRKPEEPSTLPQREQRIDPISATSANVAPLRQTERPSNHGWHEQHGSKPGASQLQTQSSVSIRVIRGHGFLKIGSGCKTATNQPPSQASQLQTQSSVSIRVIRGHEF